MSPSRFPFRDASEENTAPHPNVVQKSTKNPRIARTNACRNRIGPPSSRTTRSPSAIFPGERPCVAVSHATGHPIATRTRIPSISAAASASSWTGTATETSHTAPSNSATCATRSTHIAIARLGSRAGRRSSSTASPVTSSDTSTSTVCVDAPEERMHRMDVDVFVAVHRHEWERLEQLTRRRRRLSGPEVDELVTLYRRTGTHLSTIRSAAPDPALVGRLSTLTARARSRSPRRAHRPGATRCSS